MVAILVDVSDVAGGQCGVTRSVLVQPSMLFFTVEGLLRRLP